MGRGARARQGGPARGLPPLKIAIYDLLGVAPFSYHFLTIFYNRVVWGPAVCHSIDTSWYPRSNQNFPRMSVRRATPYPVALLFPSTLNVAGNAMSM